MKKKNLLILLIIPFLVSTLTIVTVNRTINLVDVDISAIEIEYNGSLLGSNDVVALQVSDTLFPLNAKGVNHSGVDVGKGNELKWSVKNRYASDSEPFAEVVKSNDKWYLKALKNGEVEVTCSNENGNVSNSFYMILYIDGAITINSTVPSSGYGRIDYTEYYGVYDLNGNTKTDASFEISVKLIPESLSKTNPVITVSDNISVDLDFDSGKVEGGGYVVNGIVRFNKDALQDKKTSLATVKVNTDVDDDMKIDGGSYVFNIVSEGVNVYSYDDLLYCTNRSDKGEIAVLHKSFESYNTYRKANNSSTECFGYTKNGNFDFNTGDKTLVKVATKYNHEYLDQWNKANPASKVDPVVNVGLNVQKDFYGNGYQINFHNLAYPTSTDAQGIPEPDTDDVFQGPLPFYTVGNPTAGANKYNIITAYGQDNIGFYVNGNDITINDVKLQNCDDVQSFTYLDYVGTVMEVYGENVTIKNSRLSNGKNVLKSYSSMNLVVDNCMLSNARNFLFMTGSFEYVKPDNSKVNNFTMSDGSTLSNRLSQFLTSESIANTILNDYINGKFGKEQYSYKTKQQMKKVLLEIQNALSKDLSGDIKGSTELKDCLFYRSGIASVAFESLFNGPFLYSSDLPTSISTFLQLFNSLLTDNEFMPENVGGTSYPVSVNVSGKTRFYDYKTFDTLDVDGLVGESISDLAQLVGKTYTIDDIFPIKELLKSNAASYTSDGAEYVNIPFAYYGGGNNYSKLTFIGYDETESKHINGKIDDNGVLDSRAINEINLLDKYLDLPVVDPVGFLGSIAPSLGNLNVEVDENTLIKTVTLVTGYEPFKFVFTKGDGHLYGEAPQIEDMKAVASEAFYGLTDANMPKEALNA